MTKKLSVIVLLLFACIPSLSAQKNALVDTIGLSSALSKAKQLRWKDLKMALSITYEWDTKLALTSYHEQIAEFGLLHAVGSLANTSGEAAVEICQRTIAQLKEQEISPQIRAGLYAELGAALNFIGESEEALGHVLAARKIYEQLGDSLRVFWTDVLVGQCYSVQKKSEKAQAYFHKAILAMEALNLGASLELCDAYNASAYDIYYNQDEILRKQPSINTDKQEAFLSKSLSVAKRLDNKLYIAKAFRCQGQMALLNKSVVAAKKLLQKSILLFAELNANYYVLEPKVDLSRCFLLEEDYRKAISILEPVVEHAAPNGWYFLLREAYTYLSISYYAVGDYEKGVLCGGRAFTFYKFISNSKRVFEMEALAAKHEKEKQVFLSKKKSQELDEAHNEKTAWRLLTIVAFFSFIVLAFAYFFIGKQNRKLKRLSTENAFLLGEANHRIKNNLQLISSLVAQEINKSSENDLPVLLNVQSKILSIAALHHHLYVQEEKEIINLTNYLQEVYHNLEGLLDENHIQVQRHFSEIFCHVNISVYIGLLLNELIMNSCKYAFEKEQEEKKIDILLEKGQNCLIFEYHDNGRGFSTGTMPRLVKLLCKQLKANFELSGDSGFSFKMTLNL